MATVDTSYETPNKLKARADNKPVFNMLQPMAFFACKLCGQKIQRDDERTHKKRANKREKDDAIEIRAKHCIVTKKYE